VLPTVSWHEEEYAALGVPFAQRGAMLDEQLEILAGCWAPGPVSHRGCFYAFEEVWVEPRPYRAEGPPLWFGGTPSTRTTCEGTAQPAWVMTCTSPK
jgi:alkanesulfonate monooxygenase SsuD/methylene tetrahydromethanopterin reductase-like flavin-dependent oxidoreductase (luciferase family)